MEGLRFDTAYAFKAAIGSYVPPNDTRVDRTTAARLVDIINVKDFGALGDGNHDDSVAVQAAILYGFNKKGALLLYFPAGTYRVSTYIDLSPGTGVPWLVVMGAGREATIIRGNVPANGNPPYGGVDVTGSGADQIFLPPGAIFTTSHNAQTISLIRDLTLWNEATDKWSCCGTMGPFQGSTLIENCRFIGKNGFINSGSFGMAMRNCIAQSNAVTDPVTGALTSFPTADVVNPTPNTTIDTFVWPGVGTFNSYNGTIGFGVNQSYVSGCTAIGFDSGFGMVAQSTGVRGCKALRCAIGFHLKLGVGGYTYFPGSSGNLNGSMIIGCVTDRCIWGIYRGGGGLVIAGNAIKGGVGPYDEAAITGAVWDNVSKVVTVTTAANHNILSGQKLRLTMSPAQYVTDPNGLVDATLTAFPNKFTYPGPSSDPGPFSSGSWNYPIQYGINADGLTVAIITANDLSAVAALGSFTANGFLFRGLDVRAMDGAFGWTIDPVSRAGFRFLQCGASAAANPMADILTFSALPNLNNGNTLNNNPTQPLILGQKFWISDAPTVAIDDEVGWLLTATAITPLGSDTLTFASVPAGIAAGMKVFNATTSQNFPITNVESTDATHIYTVGTLNSQQIEIGDVIGVGGGGNNTYLVRFNGTAWIRCA